MKKIVITLMAALLGAGVAFAQDLAQATEMYNNGATALSMGSKADAVTAFQNALKMALACGEDGAEVVANCKNNISNISLSIAKDLIKAADYDAAIAKLEEVAKIATEFGVEDVVAEAKELGPQVLTQKGTTLLKAKDFAAAAETFKSVVQADSTNANAALYLGMALASAGDNEGAESALLLAAANGQEANAKKQLTTLALKNASAFLKVKKFKDAVAAALKANEYGENAQAYLIAGQASQQMNANNDAIKYFEKFLALAPTDAKAGAITFTVGALYQQAGNKAKAVEAYNKVLNDSKYGAQAKQMIDALK